jgi:ubiquinone/menaquinone biosynthesis C-methylase UbiE
MNADRIAVYYESLERLCFGRALERRRLAFLCEAETSRYALICGGGDGRFLARLLHSNPRVEVDFVDSSPKMTSLAQRRIAGMRRSAARRVQFTVGDIRDFRPHYRGYDLIATNFFLDCFTDQDVTRVIEQLSSWTLPDALWMISEFQTCSGKLERLWQTTIVRTLYFAFRMTTGLGVSRIPNYAKPLQTAGFLRRREQSAMGGLLISSVWQREPT